MMSLRKNIFGKINRDFEEREARKNAEILGYPYIDMRRVFPNFDFLRLISKEDAEKAHLFPLEKIGKRFRVAVLDPQAAETKKLVDQLSAQGFRVEMYVCSFNGLQEVLPVYDSEILQKKEVKDETQFDEADGVDAHSVLQEFLEKKDFLSTVPAQLALNEIKMAAIRTRASDIHLQPHEKGVTLRFRIDGVLYDLFDLDHEIAKQLIMRIKYESGMRSNVSDIPQDGHMDFVANNRTVDLRVSTVPTPGFESVVIRILDSKKGIKRLEDLGLSPFVQEKVRAAFLKTNGLILVTGPTGSGKTTTLYSIISELNAAERKIVTLEDPIEYHLEGVLQSQVDEKHAYDFETGFTALLRHDPDIILVGEIRSHETAKLAAESALTGHLVLSSLHTNSSVGAISRLRNLQLEDFNIAPILRLVMAQRLIRELKPGKFEMVSIPKDTRVQDALKRLKKVFPERNFPKMIPKALETESLNACYEGRIAISEVFEMTDDLQKMVLDKRSEVDITHFLREKTDFLTLFEDGFLKVLEGKTTLEELYRVVG